MTVKMGKCHCLMYALIVPVNHKMDVKPTHICTSNSLCLHTEGLFFFLVLLLVDLSHCVYCRWIILHFHLERSWEKKKERETGLWWDFMAGFPWMSLSGSHVQISVRFTHCSRLPSAPRGISRAGWPVGVRASGCIFYLFFWPCHLAENVVWQATKPTVTKQGIDWIISVSSDRPPAASNTAGINGCQSYREEIGNLFVSEFNVLHLMFCSTL